MCGIVGIFPIGKLNKKEDRSRLESSLFLFTEILQRTSLRGEDATGVTALFENGDFMIQKMAKSSPEFIGRFGESNKHYNGFLDLCRENPAKLQALIGHCRKSSVGSKSNENNHPIKAGDIVGVHNGTLNNHDIIFQKLKCKRDGAVDSEAIFRLMHYFTANGKEPFTLEILEEVATRLDGAFSVIAYNVNNPYQIAVMKDKRPMIFTVIKPLKIVVIVSEEKFIDNSLFAYNKIARLYNMADFIPIATSDVNSQIFPENNVGILDLTKEITAETEARDMVIRKDVFKSIKKWQAPSAYSYNNYNSYKAPAANTNAHTALANAALGGAANQFPVDTSTENKPTFEGLVFCKELNKYVAPDEVVKAAKIGATLINTNSGDIKALTVNEETKTTDKTEKADEEPNTTVLEKTTVDLAVEPEIVQAAKDSKLTLCQYKDNKDLAEDLAVVDTNSLEALQPFTLANRVRKHVCQSAFIEGAQYYKNLIKNKTGFQKAQTQKEDTASSVIRVAKKVINVFKDIVDGIHDNNDDLREALKSTAEDYDGGDFTPDNLSKLFSAGDRKKSGLIDIFCTLYEKEKNNGEKSINS